VTFSIRKFRIIISV